MALKRYSEPRVVRPNNLWDICVVDKIEWRLSNDDLFTSDQKIIIENRESDVSPVIRVRINEGAIRDSNLNKEEYDIAVIYEHKILKDSFVIFQNSLADFEGDISIPHELQDEVIWDTQSLLKVIVFANIDSPNKDLVYGQIISNTTLELRSEDDEGKTFPIEFLDQNQFKEKGYAAKTTYAFSITADTLNESVEEAGRTIRIYVSKSLTALTNKNIFNSIMVSELLCDILILGHREFEDYEELDNDSLLASLTRKVASRLGIDVNDIIKASQADNPSVIRSYTQQYWEVSKSMREELLS